MRMSLGKGYVRRRLPFAVLAVASSVALVASLGLTPASAQGTTSWVDAESGLCLDGNDAENEDAFPNPKAGAAC